MKNPTVSALGVLVMIAALVAGFVLLTRGEDSGMPEVSIATTAPERPTFSNLSPREQRKKGNIERTLREFERIKQVGEKVDEDVYKIVDESGENFYVTKLFEGIGRNGEPLYMSAAYRQRPMLPMRKRAEIPEHLLPKLKTTPMKVLTFGTGTPGEDQSGTGPVQDSGAGGSAPAPKH